LNENKNMLALGKKLGFEITRDPDAIWTEWAARSELPIVNVTAELKDPK
jgi:hypothetical protein